MLLEDCHDGLDCNVNKLLQVVQTDTKLQCEVCSDVKLLLHGLTGHNRSERGPGCSSFLVKGWKNGYVTEWSAVLSYSLLKTQF